MTTRPSCYWSKLRDFDVLRLINNNELRYFAWTPFTASVLLNLRLLLWKKMNFCDGGAAVWRINVLLTCHDGGIADLPRAFVSRPHASENGRSLLCFSTKRSRNKPSPNAAAYLRCCVCRRLVGVFPSQRWSRSKEWKTDGVIWQLPLVPAHRGGADVGPERPAARTVLLIGIPGALSSNMTIWS